MSKHKSEDYKIIAVKYYLENDTNYTKTCEIFKCSERSLKRWIERYEELEEIKRLNIKPTSYKITKDQVKYAIQKLKENERCKLKTKFLICNLLHKKNF
jgi:transposase